MKTSLSHTHQWPAALLTALIAFASTASLFGAPVKSGTWTKKANAIAGGWSVVSEGGKNYVQFDAEFKTKRGPDLKIFLSPKEVKQVTGKNATQGSVKVGLLKKSKGAQRYELPAGLSLADYKSILIHCEKYSKLWGAGAL